jgi:hypothetical protein
VLYENLTFEIPPLWFLSVVEGYKKSQHVPVIRLFTKDYLNLDSGLGVRWLDHLDLICHNIGIPLKHDKYIFDIPIPFCHPLYLSATLKQSFREFAVVDKVSETVYMSAPGLIPTCDLI